MQNTYGQGTHTNAFNNIKEAICQETLLAYYDKDRPVFIEVDASGQGLGVQYYYKEIY